MTTGTTRYAEIAAELREWIEQGRLRPGDRVPSTREITRRWGVAMATATKVLTELRTQGLVQSVPGSGTTVAPRPTPPPAKSPRAASPRAASPRAASQRAESPRADPAQSGPPGSRLDATSSASALVSTSGPTSGPIAGPIAASAPASASGPAPASAAAAAAAEGLGAGRAVVAGGVGVEAVVRAALEVADSEGLGAVSMRRVAGELDVATMSLYRLVADKDDLLLRMMDAAFAEEPLPADLPGAPSTSAAPSAAGVGGVPGADGAAGGGGVPSGWRPRLELAAARLWRLFRRHPWLASAMSVTRPQPIPHAIPYTEWTLATLEDHGLDRDSAFTAHITLFNYIRGTAINLETESEAEALTGLDNEQWIDAQAPALRAIIDEGDFPRLRTLTEREYDFDLDTIFTFGLDRYLDGLAPLLDA